MTSQSAPRKPMRLWPGVVLAILLGLVRFLMPAVLPNLMVFGVLGGLAIGLAIVLWWLFFSRAPWLERLGALALMVVALFGTRRLVDKSIAGGAMGMLFPILAVPVVCLAFVACLVATRRLSSTARRVAIAATILLASGVWTLIRTGGFTGDFRNDLGWRWAKTPEERLLAQSPDEFHPALTSTVAQASSPASLGGAPPPVSTNQAEWPGFRGPNRDGIVHGVRIETDWSRSPPLQLWRKPVGPGWSSFAVSGDLLYTQEQRGEEEVVACYNAAAGAPVWKHQDPCRFWESNGGAGPRATPTLNHGRLYTLGGTGMLNALDAANGSVLWSRNAASDTGAKLPMWGFAGSPLVISDLVIVATSGKLAAYDIATGQPRWFGPKGPEGYSSPQPLSTGGDTQILHLSGSGLASVSALDGKVLWEHAWKGYPIVQPAVSAEGDVFISVNEKDGIRRLSLTHSDAGWTVQTRWTSPGLKPYFNDFVLHKGHAFGFDRSILACIDLEEGKRKWKGGRYGNGQLILLADQDLLLVLSEEGEVALVAAGTEEFKELARFRALEGKTWNHPVLVGDRLLVRNAQEMAAFRLGLVSTGLQ